LNKPRLEHDAISHAKGFLSNEGNIFVE